MDTVCAMEECIVEAVPPTAQDDSDASESGAGACYSKSLSAWGQAMLIRELSAVAGFGRDVVALVSLFDGISGARQALENLRSSFMRRSEHPKKVVKC